MAEPKQRVTAFTAFVAVISALIGAIAGGVASYLGNRELEEGRSEEAAEGAARVFQLEFGDEASRYAAMLDFDQVIAPSRASPVVLDAQDKQLVASQMEADAWLTVGSAELSLNIAREQQVDTSPFRHATAGELVRLSPVLERAARGELKTANAAIKALAPVAGNEEDFPGPLGKPRKGAPGFP